MIQHGVDFKSQVMAIAAADFAVRARIEEVDGLYAGVLSRIDGSTFASCSESVLDVVAGYLADFDIDMTARVEVRNAGVRYSVEALARLAALWAVDARRRVAGMAVDGRPSFSFFIRQRQQWRAEVMVLFTLTSRHEGQVVPTFLTEASLPGWARPFAGEQFVSARRVEYLATLAEARNV